MMLMIFAALLLVFFCGYAAHEIQTRAHEKRVAALRDAIEL